MNLKAQIKESFFNPILQVLPILVFIFVSYISNRMYAWTAAMGTALVLTIYVYIAYRRLFKWYLFYMLLFLIVISIISVLSIFITNSIISPVLGKIVLLVALVLMLIFQQSIVKIADKLVSPLIPMSNNIAELYRNIKAFIALVLGYLVLYFIFMLINNANTGLYLKMLNYIFFGLFAALILYDFIKTYFVRSQLAGERWLPIITKEGKVIGTILRLSSLADRRKYMHPVVRGILINESRILMQEMVPEDDLFYKPLWDSLIDKYVGIGEKAEDCLKKAAFENFGIEDVRAFYLTKYIHNTPYEHQYELVFIICNYSGELVPNPQKIKRMKWWTMPQIEANLDSGIFDQRFIKEYDLLKRSGLLESEEYNCKCESEEAM